MNIENAISVVAVLVLAITFATAFIVADIRIMKKRQNKLLNELKIATRRAKDDRNNDSNYNENKQSISP
jgi:hypothetical protein